MRAIAGELEGGTLELVLTRPVSRVRYLLSWIAVLVPGAAAIALAYSLGCILAWELFHPVGGHVHPWHMLESARLHDAPARRDRRASACSRPRSRASADARSPGPPAS